MHLDLLVLDIIFFYQNLPLNGAAAEKRAHINSTTNSRLLKKGQIVSVKLEIHPHISLPNHFPSLK